MAGDGPSPKPPPPAARGGRRGRGLGLGSRTVIPDRKTADEPNDWTKCLLGHAGPRGSIAAPLTLLEIEDRQVAFAVCDLELGADRPHVLWP
jgi:hypothetical protein